MEHIRFKQLMMITLTIYSIIISLIIFKGFYKNIAFMKPFSVKKNTASLSTSIQIESLPFYFNQGKINLFSLFINFFFLSFLSCTLIPDLISNHIAFCQDNNDSDSTIDSDNGKSIEHYYGENDIYEINKNRKKEIEIEERDLLYYDYGSRRYYPDNYEGIYKKTIEETYRISDRKYPYIHLLNSFSDFENDNHIKINNYLKVFQGFSKDIENLIEKQNNLIQKTTPIDKHSFKISRISNMFYEISKRSMDTLVLISFAYDNIMDSFYKKDNDDISGDHQINNLNLKVTKIFNSLEIIQKISKENSNNLHELIAHPRELKDLNLKINNSNILIIQDIYSRMPEENQIKTFEELYNYRNFNEDFEINWNKIENIHYNIRDFYKSKIFTKDIYKRENLLDKGFYLENINKYDESSDDSDEFYY